MNKTIFTVLSSLCFLSVPPHCYSLMLDDDMIPGDAAEERHMREDILDDNVPRNPYAPPSNVNEKVFYSKLCGRDKQIYNGLNADQRAFVLRVANMRVEFDLEQPPAPASQPTGRKTVRDVLQEQLDEDQDEDRRGTRERRR